MGYIISSYCRIKSNRFIVNGVKIPIPADAGSSFLMECYKQTGLNYPKFHKMDGLCKLGLIATEAALQNTGFLQRHDPSSVAIILSNTVSSLETDRVHQHSIDDVTKYLPSPSTFVYTLPNIVIGEIAIKHKITGENAFFVSPEFNAGLLVQQNHILLKQNHISAVISGWIDNDKGQLDTLIYLAESADDSIKNTNFKALNEITIKQLY